MNTKSSSRRNFFKSNLNLAAGLAMAPGLGAFANVISQEANTIYTPKPAMAGRIKFGVIGINHGHIYSMIDAVTRGGGELVSFYAKEEDLAQNFKKRFPNVRREVEEKKILEDPSLQLIMSSGIPDDRAPLGVRVMQHGKDYLVDKPGVTTLEQLALVKKVQKQTGRIYSIMYSERLENRATIHAGELVKAGAIGKVIQTIGLGPHRINPKSRPDWFWDKARFGGIICDIASHQFDQFLFFTGSTSGEIVASQKGNLHYPQYPKFEDFGDAMVRGNKGVGYIRVDWYSPDGLKTWGDGRLTILGTEGFIEIRKNVDIGGREGGNHLFLVDQKETRYIDCSKVVLPFGEQFVDDVVNRTETAMPQAHTFLATELTLKAQKQASLIKL